MSRSAVFLDEMGVGPLWRLRQGAAPEVVDIVVEASLEMDVAVAAPLAEAVEAVTAVVTEVVAEVQQHIGRNQVRAVAMSSEPTVIVRRPLDEADAASATD